MACVEYGTIEEVHIIKKAVLLNLRVYVEYEDGKERQNWIQKQMHLLQSNFLHSFLV